MPYFLPGTPVSLTLDLCVSYFKSFPLFFNASSSWLFCTTLEAFLFLYLSVFLLSILYQQSPCWCSRMFWYSLILPFSVCVYSISCIVCFFLVCFSVHLFYSHCFMLSTFLKYLLMICHPFIFKRKILKNWSKWQAWEHLIGNKLYPTLIYQEGSHLLRDLCMRSVARPHGL